MGGTENHLDRRDVDTVVGRYQKRVREYGLGDASLSSGSDAKQRARHEVHAGALRGENPRVLDIGCGLGAFYQFLQKTGRSARYTGYDLVPEYVDACRAAFTDATFEGRNFFEDGIDGEFDTVVMSQVLNNRYSHSDNLKVMENAMRGAFAAAKVSVSIDMMSSFVDFNEPHLYYYDPAEILRRARSITRRVVIRHDYRPYEFCVQLYRDDVPGFVP